MVIIHRIHRSRQCNNTDGISKHRLSPYNAHYLNYNFLLSFRLEYLMNMRFKIIQRLGQLMGQCWQPLGDVLHLSDEPRLLTSIVHSKLDYCNSMYYNLPQFQMKRFQNIQNSLARAVTRMPKSSHITPVLKSLHSLKINERIKYKLLSLSHKVLTTSISRNLNIYRT